MLRLMQAPMLIFDHTNKTVTQVPVADKRLAEFIAAQREQVATSGRRPTG